VLYDLDSGMRGRGRSTLDFEEELVGIAPPPVLAGLVGADERVVCVLVPMSCGMTAR
jgi:hypothetical protein